MPITAALGYRRSHRFLCFYFCSFLSSS